ncbi:DUF6597 domain-containing transcriptional factor [Arcticibacter sp.]|uniref:DUF6597 domain-containing transcriptional factor n=1 Tax=Arcticibacter sp. TaxID=1872630 RepID=UPI00388FC98F
MSIRTIEPRPDLQGIVKRFWHTDSQQGYDDCQSVRILADGAPGIIFQHSNGHSTVRDSIGCPLPISFVYGQSTNPCKNQVTASPFIFGVDLFPAALKRVFGVDAFLLTNSIVDLECLIGSQFNDQLLNAADVTTVIDLFSISLFRRLVQQECDYLIEESIRQIMNRAVEVTARSLPSDFNISQRQFQRRFRDHIGVCPETYIRIVKFQQSIHLLQNQHYHKLNAISYALGYTDQSYFNREFKFFSGYTPKEFLKTLTIQQPFYQRSKRTLTPLRILLD